MSPAGPFFSWTCLYPSAFPHQVIGPFPPLGRHRGLWPGCGFPIVSRRFFLLPELFFFCPLPLWRSHFDRSVPVSFGGPKGTPPHSSGCPCFQPPTCSSTQGRFSERALFPASGFPSPVGILVCPGPRSHPICFLFFVSPLNGRSTILFKMYPPVPWKGVPPP